MMTKLNLRKLPDKREYYFSIKKSMMINGIKVVLPNTADEVFEALNKADGYGSWANLYGRKFIQSLMDLGFIRNCNRGGGGNKVMSQGKYYGTPLFRQHYPQIKEKINQIMWSHLFDAKGNDKEFESKTICPHCRKILSSDSEDSE